MYSDEDGELDRFMSLPGNCMFRYRIVPIKGLRGDVEKSALPVYGVLVGLAQFAQHYLGIYRAPNATWTFNEGEGFSRGSPELVVESNHGVAIDEDIVINCGPNFDFSMGRRGHS